MKRDYRELIVSLAQRIRDVLKPLVSPKNNCALLDFPNHWNVGDSAIWLGEKTFLQSINSSVVYTCDPLTYSKTKLAKRLRDGPIFLSGGGNLGDIWPRNQRFREQIISDFLDTQIIQLPQTIYFKDTANLERARSIFNNHRDLILLVRDERSLNIARKEFRARSYLCPDMAFMLGELPRPNLPRSKIVWLARTDLESSGSSHFHAESDVYKTDWRSDDQSLIFRANTLLNRLARRKTPVLRRFASSMSCAYDNLARRRLLRGCSILSKGQVVITDRLHGHILSILMGIPCVLLDNNYGKVKSFYDTWTKDCDIAMWANFQEDALAAGRSLARAANEPLER